ncbi:hypothetical protein PILCRDRAFT_815565 [Piloderma croceum F 1598]|uniref:Uncharacterized protein n=1 Tax=Piloderma croceum (strain F 1598) TaxID=765440 RepID=A0A0C3FSE7_PILCF|nr:hypothetical protein PILCRDRAFT_815565 [Piloderma croceum F 1598]
MLLLKILHPRLLHSSSRASNLIGPPHPVSNLRPVLYTDRPPSSQPRPRHPYSLSEFTGGTQDHNLQWRLQRQALDAFNHNYWTDSNTRFEEAKQSVLSSLPESSTPLAREHALSVFYRKWVMQESRRGEVYNIEWRKRNFEEIASAVRIEWRNLQDRVANLMTFNKDK